MNDFAEKLPIDEVLNELIKAMREKNHAVLQAPPGAGKTTRIPIALLASDLFEKKNHYASTPTSCCTISSKKIGTAL